MSACVIESGIIIVWEINNCGNDYYCEGNWRRLSVGSV